jgi:hypothetical protein
MSLYLPLVSDNPWEKGANEADEIQKVVLEDMGLQAAPQQGTHDHHKYVNITTQYEKQVAFLRELLNYLPSSYVPYQYQTTRQARIEYFLNKNAANSIKLFTAQNIID